MGEQGQAGQARGGGRAQAPTIAVLSSLVGGYYFGDLVEAIDKVATRRGARLIALQTTRSWEVGPTAPASYIPVGWAHFDGFIVVSDALAPAGMHCIVESGKPLVTISAHNPLAGYPAILPDNRGGVLAAVRHLLDHGHQRIGFVGWLEQEDMRQRHEAYRAALSERGITPDPALFFAATDTLETGGQAAAALAMAAGMP
jgi:DNA-binding LacI/PurR family transcriptional regulator